MRVGILGGSFDPVHKGHLQMAKEAYKQLHLDEVWFMPTKDTPLKDRNLTSFAHRYRMCEIAVRPYRYMKVCDIENTLEGKSYTIRTMRELKKRYPAVSFFFLMGEDQVAQLEKWKDIDALQKEVQLCAFERNHQAIVTPYDVKPLVMKPILVSSSEVRAGNYTQVPKAVAAYMIKHMLYLDFVKDKMSVYRYEHSVRVAKLCATIARANALDENKAYLCGLLHDINKEFTIYSIEESETVIKTMCPKLLTQSKSIWHGYMGRFVCVHKLGIQDQDVLEAIEHHVLGECHAQYAKILYMADKLDPNREYDTAPTIALACKDMHAGYKEVRRQQKAFYNEESNNE